MEVLWFEFPFQIEVWDGERVSYLHVGDFDVEDGALDLWATGEADAEPEVPIADLPSEQVIALLREEFPDLREVRVWEGLVPTTAGPAVVWRV